MVTVTVEYNGKFPTDHKTIEQLNQDLYKEYGKVISETEKKYTVSGLKYYLSNSSQISDETLKKMQSNAEESVRENIKNKFGNDVSVDEVTYLGNYFLLNKGFDDGLLGKDYNKFYLLFSVKATIDLDSKGDYKKTIEYIFSAEYDELYNLADDSIGADLTAFKSPSESFTIDTNVKKNWISNYVYKFNGYKDRESAYNKIISAQSDDYTYEKNLE